MSKINQKTFIELYNVGRDDIELAELFGVSERSIQRYSAKLRKKGKIKYRVDMPTSKTVSSPKSYAKEIPPINWQITKTKKKKVKERPFSSYLVIGDTHVPYTNEVSTKAVLKIMDNNSFDGFVILGDFMDMAPISHWLKNKKKTLENKRMITDYMEGNKLLDEFDKRLPKSCDKRFFYGNHEDWYFQLIEELPALEGFLDPKEELKLVERGYKVYETINHIERIGKLSFTHGIYHSLNFVKKHIDSLKTNVIIGHLHQPRERFEMSPAREIAIAGYAVGCLSDLSPAFMKNRPNAWCHGYTVVNFYGDGYFDVTTKRIVKGVTIYNGKMYNGNE